MSECIHYEIISAPSLGEDIIGTCIYCGRKKNYSILQRQYNVLYGQKALAHSCTLDHILKTRTGMKKKQVDRRKRLSRGRVINNGRGAKGKLERGKQPAIPNEIET